MNSTLINKKEFFFSLLRLENSTQYSTSRLRFWFDHIRNNALNDDGDIFEFGVYQGGSLISAALLLKEVGSKKTIYGFDSFTGFPSYSEYDDLNCFHKYLGKYIDQEIYHTSRSKNICNCPVLRFVFFFYSKKYLV